MKTAGIENRHSQIQQAFLKKLPVPVILLAFILVGCATTSVDDQQQNLAKKDPYENVNRKVYKFNDYLDDYVAEPVSKAYRWATPQLVQTGIYNFFYNLKDIRVALNDLLQAKFSQSAQDAGRFAINSTLGLGGLVDVAKDAGLPQHEEDFEQTLATWGVPQGPYLIIPFLGPMTTRGVPSAIIDTAVNPASWIGAPIQLVEFLHRRASSQSLVDTINESFDPYVFVREAYIQRIDYLARDGKSMVSADIDAEMGNDKPQSAGKQQTSKTASDKADYALVLTAAETDESQKKPHSFTKVAKTFDNTSLVFQDASFKLARLSKNKK